MSFPTGGYREDRTFLLTSIIGEADRYLQLSGNDTSRLVGKFASVLNPVRRPATRMVQHQNSVVDRARLEAQQRCLLGRQLAPGGQLKDQQPAKFRGLIDRVGDITIQETVDM